MRGEGVKVGLELRRDKEIRQGHARGGGTFQVHHAVVFSVCCEILTEIYTTGMALNAK